MKMYETDNEMENLTLPAIVYQSTTATNSLLPANGTARTYEKFYLQLWIREKNVI